MLKKYKELKARHKDALLLFRCGNFYETFEEDAEKASRVLGITLAKRPNTKANEGKPTTIAGFPYHALDTYLPKLIRSGYRVCICDNIDTQPPTKKRTIGDPQKNNENHIPKGQGGQEDEHHNNQRHGHSR